MRSMKDITQDAIDIVKPSIDKLFERTNRKELHIVVMNPHLKPWEASFEDAILYEESLGSPDNWTIKFDHLARKKAQQAWRESTSNLTLHSSTHLHYVTKTYCFMVRLFTETWLLPAVVYNNGMTC